MRKKILDLDMTNGPLFGKILRMSIPLMLTGLLQLLYNAADVIVVGQFAGETSLAAVGSTGSLINLLVNLFMGMSQGAGVVVAQFLGARATNRVKDAVQTSMILSVILGIVVGVLGFFASRPILLLMGTPADVLPKATLYVKIYFLGIPGLMVYNFCSSILRAAGDTKRPLYILSATGVVNVALNLLLVIQFHLDVAGVAIATIVAQYLSAGAALVLLLRTKKDYRLSLKDMTFNKTLFLQIVKYGVPIGVQGSFFSLSNIVIQSSVNSLGSVVMAGSAASGNIEGFLFVICDAASQSALTFTSQNIGAGKPERVDRVLGASTAITCMFGIACGLGISLFPSTLLHLYSGDAAVIAAGIERLQLVAPAYVLCGLMNLLANVIRGLGYPIRPTIITLFFACAFRIIWCATIFSWFPNVQTLYAVYPVSWGLAVLCSAIVYLTVRKKPKVRLAI